MQRWQLQTPGPPLYAPTLPSNQLSTLRSTHVALLVDLLRPEVQQALRLLTSTQGRPAAEGGFSQDLRARVKEEDMVQVSQVLSRAGHDMQNSGPAVAGGFTQRLQVRAEREGKSQATQDWLGTNEYERASARTCGHGFRKKGDASQALDGEPQLVVPRDPPPWDPPPPPAV